MIRGLTFIILLLLFKYQNAGNRVRQAYVKG